MPTFLHILTLACWVTSFFFAHAWLQRRRRDFFAAAALAGLLADHLDHSEECEPDETCPETVARLAVAHADAVLKRLEATESP